MRTCPRPETEAGFSLIEVLIALTILSFGLLGIFSIHDYTIQTNENSAKMTEAVNLAQQKMDFFGSLAFQPTAMNPLLNLTGGTDPTAPGDPITRLVALSTNQELVNRFGDMNPAHGPLGYTRSWRIDPAPGANNDRIIMMVRVTFLDDDQRPHGITLVGSRSWDGDGRY